MSKKDFLLEIGLEEMPARFVTDAMNQLKEKMKVWLDEEKLTYDSISAYSTPRRLAVIVHGLGEKQADTKKELRGPAKKIAIDENGQWTKAALGFARGQGVSEKDLYFKEIKNQTYVFAKKFIPGKETISVLPQVKDIITQLHFPVHMRWNVFDLKFIRPIRWLVALYGTEIVPFTLTNVTTDRKTYGHRFLGKEITLNRIEEYVSSLRNEYVIVDPEERKNLILEQLKQLEQKNGWKIPVDEELLEEVNNLVEYPTAVSGSFDAKFLEIPEEVLITSMREHQRYFPVRDENEKLLPHFVTIRNGDDRHLENIIKGNEKVLRARLSDAQFFYEEDKKLKLDDCVNRLDTIVYHEDLGSLGNKVRRIEKISAELADLLGIEQKEEVRRAAKLCKFDLVTQMVNEFPELEGKMGEVYALHAGESPAVAKAINEHYKPRFSGDTSPESLVGTVVSIADKLDTITACFAIGLIPTGSQDPYALRRQAAGIVQMLIDHELPVELKTLFELSLRIAEENGLLKRTKEDIMSDLDEFFKLRLKNTLQEENIRYDIIDAVLTTKLGRLHVLLKKAKFLQEKLHENEFKEVVETLSRVTNISQKAGENFAAVNEALFEKEEEKVLYDAYVQLKERLPSYLEKEEIEKAYDELKALKEPINNYFDNIMVMVENETVKQNRLCQMKALTETIQTFANFQAIVL